MYIEELEGKIVTEVQTFYAGDGCYMLMFLFTDGTTFRIEREHTIDHSLVWKIEG
ncbi:hypothetical protein ABE073_04230 [Lederbergia citrisecunda]|uniref:hypothetical protein n=1 Tax=Lederbergia citrisecunda TaxID=2833583 RepID=UPI003D2A5B2A